MKKSALVLLLLTICLIISGCGGSMMSLPEGTPSFEQMPPTPAGLEEPTMTGHYSKPASNITVIEDSLGRMVVEYAIAPDSVSIFKEGLSEKRITEFSKQYAESLDHDFVVDTFTFFNNPSLLITGVLNNDTQWAKTGDAAIYHIMPYDDYIIIVRAHCLPENANELLSMSGIFVEAYIANGVSAIQ